jgi:phage terminase large subunit-like protein
MCAVNSVSVSDPAGNRKLAKNKSTGRIDGMVALAMAVGVMPQDSYDAQLTNYLMNAII